jgi:hypothetical protein
MRHGLLPEFGGSLWGMIADPPSRSEGIADPGYIRRLSPQANSAPATSMVVLVEFPKGAFASTTLYGR